MTSFSKAVGVMTTVTFNQEKLHSQLKDRSYKEMVYHSV